MARDMLRVDGISPDIKAALQASAQARYGTPNASQLVRELIAEHLKNAPSVAVVPKTVSDLVRVELRLPRQALDVIDAHAEARFASRNYYLVSLVLAHQGRPQLMGDEIEVLRRSNYELAKIGTNLNQVARAFHVLVQAGDGKMPEIGKKLAALRKEVREHVARVLRVLEAGTAMWEIKGRGQRPRSPHRR